MADSIQQVTRRTEEESARRILSIFDEMSTSVGRSLSTEQLRARFLATERFGVFDFEEGAKYAIQQGWVAFVGGTRVLLLPPGRSELGAVNAASDS